MGIYDQPCGVRIHVWENDAFIYVQELNEGGYIINVRRFSLDERNLANKIIELLKKEIAEMT